jgi:hypothetical protein
MSKGLSVAELDMEQATHLPPREVMWGCRSNVGGTHISVSYTNGSYDGNADGDTSQSGLINVALLNGNFDGDGNGSSFLSL